MQLHSLALVNWDAMCFYSKMNPQRWFSITEYTKKKIKNNTWVKYWVWKNQLRRKLFGRWSKQSNYLLQSPHILCKMLQTCENSEVMYSPTYQCQSHKIRLFQQLNKQTEKIQIFFLTENVSIVCVCWGRGSNPWPPYHSTH